MGAIALRDSGHKVDYLRSGAMTDEKRFTEGKWATAAEAIGFIWLSCAFETGPAGAAGLAGRDPAVLIASGLLASKIGELKVELTATKLAGTSFGWGLVARVPGRREVISYLHDAKNEDAVQALESLVADIIRS